VPAPLTISVSGSNLPGPELRESTHGASGTGESVDNEGGLWITADSRNPS
jgi:hypothetical protein